MYDITNKESFNEVSIYYKKLIGDKCTKNQKIILLGCKIDLEELRKVSFEEGKSLAQLNNYIFMEISCLKNENIKKAMEIAISVGLKDIQNQSNKKGQIGHIVPRQQGGVLPQEAKEGYCLII